MLAKSAGQGVTFISSLLVKCPLSREAGHQRKERYPHDPQKEKKNMKL